MLNILLTALAPMIWGSTYLVTTELLPPDRPFTAALLRVLPAGLLLLACTRRWPNRTQWPRLLVLAVLNIGAFQALLFVAAYRLPGGLAAVVGAIQPLLIVALARAVDHIRPRPLTVVACLLGVFGMGLLLLSPSSHWDAWGMAAALLGATCMAAGTFLTRRWSLGLPVLALTGWQLLLGGLMLLPVAVRVDPPLPQLGMGAIAGYAYLSLAGAMLAYALWFRGVARLPGVAVASLGLLSPVTATLLGWAVLGQAFRGVSLLGMLLVLASIMGVQWAAQTKRR